MKSRDINLLHYFAHNYIHLHAPFVTRPTLVLLGRFSCLFVQQRAPKANRRLFAGNNNTQSPN